MLIRICENCGKELGRTEQLIITTNNEGETKCVCHGCLSSKISENANDSNLLLESR